MILLVNNAHAFISAQNFFYWCNLLWNYSCMHRRLLYWIFTIWWAGSSITNSSLILIKVTTLYSSWRENISLSLRKNSSKFTGVWIVFKNLVDSEMLFSTTRVGTPSWWLTSCNLRSLVRWRLLVSSFQDSDETWLDDWVLRWTHLIFYSNKIVIICNDHE